MMNGCDRIDAATLSTGTLVECYIALRDRRGRRKAEYEVADEADKKTQAALEGLLLKRFAAEGVESVRCPAGTAFRASAISASVTDRDTFFTWACENNEHMLDIRVNRSVLQTYREETQSIPPGINFAEASVLRVRRA
jgi:hypothetical protein